MKKIYHYHANYAIYLIILISRVIRQFFKILFRWKTEKFFTLILHFCNVTNILEIISGFKNEIFFVLSNFFMNFDFKNDCKNELMDNNKKSYSCSRNKVSHKIDFKAVWLRNAHADSVQVNNNGLIIIQML